MADENLRGVLLEVAKDLKPVPKSRKVVSHPVFRLAKNRWLKAVA